MKNRLLALKRVFVAISDWGESVYDAFMAVCLVPFNPYYDPPQRFIRRVCTSYWGLSPRKTKKVLRLSPAAVVGHRAVQQLLRHRMHLHAFRAMAVTTLCSIGDGWWIYPLIVFDLIYFQREVFAFAQEAFLLCRPHREYVGVKFDYPMVALLGTRVMEPFVFRQVKKGIGKLGALALRKGTGVLRGPARVFIRQMAKWMGLTIAKGCVEDGFTWFDMIACAVISGLISYWMFLPMAKRAMPALMGRRARTLFAR